MQFRVINGPPPGRPKPGRPCSGLFPRCVSCEMCIAEICYQVVVSVLVGSSCLPASIITQRGGICGLALTGHASVNRTQTRYPTTLYKSHRTWYQQHVSKQHNCFEPTWFGMCISAHLVASMITDKATTMSACQQMFVTTAVHIPARQRPREHWLLQFLVHEMHSLLACSQRHENAVQLQQNASGLQQGNWAQVLIVQFCTSVTQCIARVYAAKAASSAVHLDYIVPVLLQVS